MTDNVGVKSVSFTIQHPGGATQSFNPTQSGTTWSIGLQGFTDGAWSWWVDAKDTAGKGGNRATSEVVNFTVVTGGGGEPPPDGDVIPNAQWLTGGAVQLTAGRLFFEMPKNAKRKGRWQGFVCSGNVVTDAGPGRSVILTAAHCVYDDVNKAFARNVLFIPNQAETSGSGTDLNCDNDPIGCWVPSWGAVDANWTASVFPANIPWDYAYYVVDDVGSHVGAPAPAQALDIAAGSLSINFLLPSFDGGVADFTHALGYSFSDDPKLMYCAEDMTTQGDDNWWLPNCGLSGGSSGGPWIQPIDVESGAGPVISVNSWGFTNSPGMAGPKLSSPSSAQCVFDEADARSDPTSTDTVDGDAGIAVTCD